MLLSTRGNPSCEEVTDAQADFTTAAVYRLCYRPCYYVLFRA